MSLGDSNYVQKITNDIYHLSSESVTIDNSLNQAQRDADSLIKSYGSNFSVINPLPGPITEIKKHYEEMLWRSRDMASAKYITHITEFVSIKLMMVEMVQTEQDLQDVIGALKDTISEKDPMEETPLNGFEGVTKAFKEVWSAVTDEAKSIVSILEKATTPEELKKIIEELKTDFVAVKSGCEKIKQALKKYATSVN